MRISKTIITFILSSILFTATFSKANAEKLLAAIADWTGGEISCQVAAVSYTHLTLPTTGIV